ncbi:hypothetical protein Tco_0034277 [Tanacetum coccineum]
MAASRCMYGGTESAGNHLILSGILIVLLWLLLQIRLRNIINGGSVVGECGKQQVEAGPRPGVSHHPGVCIRVGHRSGQSPVETHQQPTRWCCGLLGAMVFSQRWWNLGARVVHRTPVNPMSDPSSIWDWPLSWMVTVESSEF